MNYTVETSDVADAEIDAAYLRLSARNHVFAGRWLEGLYRIIATLDFLPTRHSQVSESAILGREVRRTLYKNGQIVYRILFTLLDTDGDSENDTVRVLRVRHGAQQPLGEQGSESEPE